jgi:hypothetical protein
MSLRIDSRAAGIGDGWNSDVALIPVERPARQLPYPAAGLTLLL